IAWVSAHNSKHNVSPAISISRFRYSRPTPAACNSTLLNPVSTTERFRNCSSGWIGCMQLLSVDGYLCRALRRLRPHESGKARQALHQQKGALVGHHLRHEIGPVLADESLEQFAVDVLQQGVEVLIGLHENDLAGRGGREAESSPPGCRCAPGTSTCRAPALPPARRARGALAARPWLCRCRRPVCTTSQLTCTCVYPLTAAMGSWRRNRGFQRRSRATGRSARRTARPYRSPSPCRPSSCVCRRRKSG